MKLMVHWFGRSTSIIEARFPLAAQLHSPIHMGNPALLETCSMLSVPNFVTRLRKQNRPKSEPSNIAPIWNTQLVLKMLVPEMTSCSLIDLTPPSPIFLTDAKRDGGVLLVARLTTELSLTWDRSYRPETDRPAHIRGKMWCLRAEMRKWRQKNAFEIKSKLKSEERRAEQIN